DALIKRNEEAGPIEFTTDAPRAVEHGLFQLFAVGTHPDEDGSADLSYVLTVARTIATHMKRYCIVVTKSTVPVGTADKVRTELERTKYAENAMLATKISFSNELAAIAERSGADIEKVRIGIGSDPRIGYSFIYPGTGYGGSCFPKDVQALIRSSLDAGHQPKILG